MWGVDSLNRVLRIHGLGFRVRDLSATVSEGIQAM